MINRTNSVAILALLVILTAGVCAQSPQPTPQEEKPREVSRQKSIDRTTTPLERLTNLQGFGVTGRIPKFGGGDYLVNSLIFESTAGKIGIGTPTPGSALSVNGQIETLAGGVKFPDGSVQLTAGVAPVEVVKSLNGLKGALSLNAGANIAITPSGNTLTVSAPDALTAAAHDATLTGNGTTLSPLSVVSSETQQQPFYASYGASFLQEFSTFELTTVPNDKRLVIQHVSGICRVPVGDRVAEVDLNWVNLIAPISVQLHYLIPSFTGTRPGFGDFYVWSQSVRFVIDPGRLVGITAKKLNSTGAGSCEGSIAGYLVDKP